MSLVIAKFFEHNLENVNNKTAYVDSFILGNCDLTVLKISLNHQKVSPIKLKIIFAVVLASNIACYISRWSG